MNEKKFEYLNKNIEQSYRRKNNSFVEIKVVNHSNKRIKINKTIKKRLNNILKELHLDNGEYII